MSGNIKQTVGVILELVGIAFLTGAAVKSECERHKAVVALHQKEFELACKEIHEVLLEAEIEHLKKHLLKQEEEKD